ncbi:MAG: N-acetyltransferase [Methanocalculus sp. MSAO_Arc1]|uniref:acyltransferase n=1 Tax=Methanocalculus TaxID=71151 RepID=UPI000FEEC29E|nr:MULTISPECIES: N-acetyltransferase [unclassified Methanocalculus]MCP1662562.1 acetyltransferase-like isoleucine patch superfamily enzyme [Methanocalculus sp. AMF5]RQD80066.1 MAG: N-acetyltransferase [Methanocalculus sp. MSAO_Arc1]
MNEYGINTIGKSLTVFEPVTIGFPSRDYIGRTDHPGTIIGEGVTLRSGTILYADVTLADRCNTGHNVLIREKTVIGEGTSVGTGTIIEGNCSIGSHVSIQSMAFIPTHTQIGDHVFIGPHAVLTNDRYPPSGKPRLEGPVIEDYATIGAAAIILPGITIGKGAAVAAGSVVTHDVPAGMMAVGSPAQIRPLPDEMKRG